MQQIATGTIISNAVAIGARNAASVIGALFLWLITLWIPYINVGTTIGLFGIIAKMGRGSAISPTEIFDPRYRKQMGEFFLVMIFMSTGVMIGYVFMLIPGIAIGLAWILAPLLVLDRGTAPMQALQDSNNLMDGNRMAAFLSVFGIQFGGFFVIFVLAYISTAIDVGIVSVIFGAAMLAVYLIMMTAILGVLAFLYATLVEGRGNVAQAQAQGPAHAQPLAQPQQAWQQGGQAAQPQQGFPQG